MPISDLIEFHTRPHPGGDNPCLWQGIYKMVDKRMEGEYLYRIDSLEQTAESHGVRITQLEANRQPLKID